MNKLIYLITLCFILSSCNKFCGEDENERSGVDQLSDRTIQWQGNQLASYQVTYWMSCFCNQETSEVTVTDGEITAVTIRNPNGDFVRDVPTNEFENYHTIDGFFELIADIDRYVDKLSVQYDAALGYPTVIDVDPHAMQCDCMGGCSDVADDEYTYIIDVALNG